MESLPVHVLRRLTRAVFGCFHGLERFFDRWTSRAGPLFVVLCTILLSLGTLTYFEAFFWPMFSSSSDSSTVSRILKPTFGLLWSCYLVAGFSLHYYYAVTTLPGSPRDAPGTTRYRPFFSWHSRQRDHPRGSSGSNKQDSRRRDLPADAVGSDAAQRSCRKCPEIPSETHDGWTQPPKPERTHHCSACTVCVLKYDHHCPWLNGCVGLHNERYFLLFMCYLCLACGSVAVLGFSVMLQTLNFRAPWPHVTPRSFSILLWILSVAIGFALLIMAVWQLWLIASNETTVEANDNDYYRKLAKRRQRVFLNPYDRGHRENLRDFFNVGPGRRYSSWSSVLLPVRVPASSNGWHWPKRAGWEANGMDQSDELTDDEGDE